MKKALLHLLLPCLILLPSSAFADKFTLTSYYPAPFGNYKSIILNPHSALPSTGCTVGTIYANASDNSIPYFCGSISGVPQFAPFPGPWTLSGSNLVLTDTSNPQNKMVGIDTTSPIFKLTLVNDGGIYADNLTSQTIPITYSSLPVGISNSALVWYPGKFAFRAGFSSTQLSDSNIGIYSMALGADNLAGSAATSVWGGQNNSAGVQPLVGPTLTLGYEVIAGGKNNSAALEYAEILGGEGNTATQHSRVSGKNNTTGDYGTIGGGENNTTTQIQTGTTIGGGYSNTSSGLNSTISGGSGNSLPAGTSTNNTISGGLNNTASIGFTGMTIAGGELNTASENYAVIGGGKSNTISGGISTILGGNANTASGTRCSIGGGSNNTCASFSSSIGGGDSNTASIGAGSTILGGQSNSAKGINATILGGSGNNAWGKYSIAAGQNMNLGLVSDYDFIWGHANALISAVTATNVFLIYSGRMGIRDIDPNALLEINGNNSTDDYFTLTNYIGTPGDRFIIKNNGYVGVNTSSPTNPLQFGNGAYVSAAGNFMPASSRVYKENISDLSLEDAIKAFSKLEPVQYHYKNEPQHEYLGFIAEDVPDLVASQDRKGIAPMDIAAVLTKVVAHQQEILEQQKAETERLLNDVQILRSKLKENTGLSR